jgi:hypothetical protein
LNVSNRINKAISAVPYQVRYGPYLIRSNHWKPEAHRFVEHESPGLEARRENQNIRHRVASHQFSLVAKAQKIDVSQSMISDEMLHLGPQRTITDKNQGGLGMVV